MDQYRSRRLADRLLEALETACEARNRYLAFCLFEALEVELDRHSEDRRDPQAKIDLMVSATSQIIVASDFDELDGMPSAHATETAQSLYPQ